MMDENNESGRARINRVRDRRNAREAKKTEMQNKRPYFSAFPALLFMEKRYTWRRTELKTAGSSFSSRTHFI